MELNSNRSSYTSTPAGSPRMLNRQPRPRRPKKEINQRFLLIFFILLPVLLLLAVFFQPLRWAFLAASLVSLVAMWLALAFLLPGRIVLTGLYGLMSVVILVMALSRPSRAPTSYTPAFSLEPQPTTTPIFNPASYSTMGTSVPEDYYSQATDVDDAFNGMPSIGIEGGYDENTPESSEESENGGVYVPDVKSEAEIALENFMEKWRKGIIADMVQYTAPSWRNAQSDPPQQQLFWKFAQKSLTEWRQMSAPSGTDTSTARTITIQADMTYSGTNRTYQYDAILLYENEGWYLDPDSISSGVLIEAATPTPDPNVTPTPSPEPTPTPGPNKKTKLYYNKDGGKLYHTDPDCPSVAAKYRPLKGNFTYGNIEKSPFDKLKPCPKCGAPERP